MTTTALLLAATDLIAAVVLSAVYFHRHRRRDLVVAFLGVNVGVLAVATVLGTAEVALGLGLGLFGVLSIIRLRSSEISQREVAYYFAALAVGLICGLPHTELATPLLLVGLIVAVLAIADHPRLLSRARHQTVHLDRAIADEDELRAALAALTRADACERCGGREDVGTGSIRGRYGAKDFQTVVFSSSAITSGQSYTVTVDGTSTTVTAGQAVAGGMGGGMGGGRP